ncbi:MAG: sigma-70 family RNA polymerase sigma factor, partial [Gemmiger sp.]
RVGNTPENVAMALESVIEPASLYEPAYTDGDDTLSIIDRVPETSGEDSWISGIMFRDTVQQLSDRERKIIALRYLSGQTQMQVAKKIGISQAQVSRLEKSALCRIREQISCR